MDTIYSIRYKFDFMIVLYCFIVMILHINIELSVYLIGLLVNILLFLLWFRFCNWKCFCLTYDRVKLWYGEQSVLPVRYGYKIEGNSDILQVYIKCEEDWYECEMDYFFPKGLSLGKYNDFVKSNDTFGKLCQTLRLFKTDVKRYRQYKANNTDYLSLKWVSLVILILVSILYWYFSIISII